MVEKTGTTTTTDEKKVLLDLIKNNTGTADGLLAFMRKYTEIAGRSLDGSFDTIEEFQAISNG
jgi:hypothetical protein